MTTEKDAPTGPREPGPSRLRRGTQAGLAVVVGVALTGYIVGLGGTPALCRFKFEMVGYPDGIFARDRGAEHKAHQEDALLWWDEEHVQKVPGEPIRSNLKRHLTPPTPHPRYDAGERPAAALSRALLRRTTAERTDLLHLVCEDAEPAATSTRLEDRQRALDERAKWRAFQGAPPAIAHRVEDPNNESCLACHKEGRYVEKRAAAKMPHTFHANCTQCHVESALSNVPVLVPGEAAKHPAGDKVLNGPAFAAKAGTTFTGLAESARSLRAWPGAPPLVPHSVWMRSDCTSCHGAFGHAALRTPHPKRRNCLQCHGVSAVLNQAPVIALPPIERAGRP